jgi:6-phosphogluconolactonase
MKRFLSVLLLLALPMGFLSHAADTSEAKKMWVYIGTYTGKKSKGIYKCDFDPATGKLSEPELVAESTSPSFLAIHPNQKLLYAVGEVADFQKQKTGAVSAFAIDEKTGKLNFLNAVASGGRGPCHVMVDRTGKTVMVANYGEGSCASCPLDADGKLQKAATVIQHKGSSVNKSRQEGPHAHSINVSPDNRFAFCADLGLDQVLIYKLDAVKGTLSANDPPNVAVEGGSGPRHFAFHPNGKFAYTNGELTSTVIAMSYDTDKGALKPIQTISTLPQETKGNSTAEVVVHPNGKFLYCSNRGHNSIAVFSVDAETGKLTVVGHQGEGISIPRNFNIDPTGKWLLVANQNGDSVIVFEIDQKTGNLKPTGFKVEVGSPVCVKFLAVK